MSVDASDSAGVSAGVQEAEVMPDAERLGRYTWYVIGLLTVVNVFNYMDRMALAVLAPAIRADLRFSDAQQGLLTGFAFALFYATCGIPIARWADRGNRRNIIAITLATWSVMTALAGAAHTFWHLFLARIGVGAGESGGMPTAHAILCDYAPLKRRAGVFAIHTCGISAGIMLGMSLAGALGESVGWRWAFVALGLPGIALAVVVRLTLCEPPRGRFDAVKEEAAGLSLGKTIGVLWRCTPYRLLWCFIVVNGFADYGLNQWWPTFYTRVHGLSLSAIGVYLGVAIGSGSIIGLLIGGLMANKAAQRDVRLPLVISAAATALALPTALGSLFASSATESLLLVALTSLFWNVSNGPVIATVYSVVASRMRATAGAVWIFSTSVLGFGLGPFTVGVLSDVLAPSLGAQSLRYALLVPIALLPLMVIALLAAGRALPKHLSQ